MKKPSEIFGVPSTAVREALEQEELCEYCGGTGEVSCDEDDGEGHTMHGVGTRKCICQIKDNDDHDAE